MVVIIVLLVAALLIWACKANKTRWNCLIFGDPYYTSTVTPSVSPTTV